MFKSRKAGRGESWDGVVVEKSRNMPDGSNMYHYVKLRLTDGETRKVRIDGTLWESLKEGDAVTKRPGADPAKG
ncbi:hypothetical protein [Streptomyces sp. NPDC050738]|uniref:DUF7489 domain-containing protein n=1 Tax=Streptomyces sp. NPDC050738 TaxID=3154744 RepID=UPI003415A932